MIEAKQELSTVESDYYVKKEYFTRNKQYYQSLLNQNEELSRKKSQLEKNVRETQSAGGEIDYIKDQVREAKTERNALQKELDQILKTPFFAKENDQSNLKRLTDLEQKISGIDLEIKKSRQLIVKQENDRKEFDDEYKELMTEKKGYTAALNKMNAYTDPNGLTVEQIQGKLQ